MFRELQTKTAELEVASRHKSEFLASMSHELRTPLNAVIGFSDVLLERMFGELNERQEEYVRDIRDSGRHLLELINEILDLSKIEAGRMELESGIVAFDDLLGHGVAMVRDRAERHGITLNLDVAADVDTVDGDELKLKQVVLNLLSNAVKFTPDGGSVSVTARIADGEVQVSVEDTGHRRPRRGSGADLRGVPARRSRGADQRRGHRPRADAVASDRRPCTVGGCGWRASWAPAARSRSRSPPARRPRRRRGTRPQRRRPPAASSGSVLVVEDDRRSADLLRVYLEDAGYSVTVAARRRGRPRARAQIGPVGGDPRHRAVRA